MTQPQISAIADETLLIALANTGHLDSDELAEPETVASWWRDLTGPPWTGDLGTSDDVRLVRAARSAIRHMTLRNNGVDSGMDDETGLLARLPLRFDLTDGPDLTVGGEVNLARFISSRVMVALLRGPAHPHWNRLKACPGPQCAWVFRDRSRNGSRRWCDMAACGNRAKAAAFRTRGGRAG